MLTLFRRYSSVFTYFYWAFTAFVVGVSRLRQAGVKLKPAKCLLFHQEVRYLGHLVTSMGYTLNSEDKAAVLKLKDRRPATGGEVRQLLGFIGYYRKYIPDFARKAKLLYDLLKVTDNLRHPMHKPWGKRTKGGQLSANQNIHWTEQHQTALIDLIDCLVQPPVMAYPQFDKPFLLHVDTSGDGLKAILYQEDQDKRLRVVAYAYRTLT